MEIYSVGDIAAAAGVPVSQVTGRVLRGGITTAGGYVGEADAVALVRSIVSGEAPPSDYPTFASVVVPTERRGVVGLMTSSALHVLVGTILLVTSFAWLTAATDESELKTEPASCADDAGSRRRRERRRSKGPAPARRANAKRRRRARCRARSEVRQPPRHRNRNQPKVEPPPPPVPVVQAPVVPKPADPVDKPGVLTPPPDPRPSNQGSGAGGGAGTGNGSGVGEGNGAGIGPGSGGGEGGGPYQPGAGIDPPSIQREVKALYTDDARRRGIEGDVVLEIVCGAMVPSATCDQAQPRSRAGSARDRRGAPVAVHAARLMAPQWT